VTYPEDYRDKNYASKEITFSVEVSSIKEKELETLDDDFARLISDHETLDELKAEVRETIQQQRQRQLDYELGSQALDKVLEAAEKIEWPQALEDESVEDEIEGLEQQLKRTGLTLDNYLQMQHKTRDELTEEIRQQVVDRLRRNLALARIAELEGLDVSNTEVLQQAKTIADMSRGGEQVWRNILASESQQRALASDLLVNKALYRLATVARGEAPEPGSSEAVESAEGEAPAGEETAEAVPSPAEAEAGEAAEAAQPADSGSESDDEAAQEESVTAKV
jgi:trigger factor